MASKTQAQKFIYFINQQIDILKAERENVVEAVDDAVIQVQSEVDAWVKGGIVNQTTFTQICHRITHFIACFMAKSVEFSELKIKENSSDPNQMSSENTNDFKTPKTGYTKEEANGTTMTSREEIENKSGVDTSCITSSRFSILEEDVLSLKKSTEQFQENVNKKLEILTNENLKSKKKIQERLRVLENTSKEMSSNVDDLFETVTNVDVKLNKLEEENKSAYDSINELNKQISSVRACSNDALMSIQDLSKSVESTNQHYNEMSNKMNQLEIFTNLMSEMFEKVDNDKVDDLIGMVCHLLSKRLAPLELLNETLNKKVILRNEHISKIESIDLQLVEISGKVTQIEKNVNQSNLLFSASRLFNFGVGCFNIDKFTTVPINNGSHFDPSSGKFTVPRNGFYLISIRIETGILGKFNINCIQRLKSVFASSNCLLQFCCASDHDCVTCLVELNAGCQLWLQFESKEDFTPGWSLAHFFMFYDQIMRIMFPAVLSK